MFKKIKALTKIFVKDFYQNTNLVNKETGKLNTKSLYFWMLIIVFIGMMYLSNKAIHFCISIGSPEMFVNFYLLFLVILLMFQTVLISVNIFFFSKDLEYIISLPIKPKEILISKFSTILFMAYATELIFALIPLTLYGLSNYTGFDYFICMILLLLLLPIFFIAIISIFTLIITKICDFIKNKNILQNIVSLILIILLIFVENNIIGNIKNLQDTNYIISSFIKILTGINFVDKLKSISMLIGADIILLSIFILLGQRLYLKTLLKCLTITKRNLKFAEKRDVKIKEKKSNVGKEYIKKEFKMLFRQPIFFVQTVLPVIMVLITVVMIANIIIPIIDSAIENDRTIKQALSSMEFSSEMVCVILGVLQCLFSVPNISLTAISREGKNAIFMKYIPISYYKQFLYKNVIQVILNSIVSIALLTAIYIYIPKIGIENIILIFVISMFINLINSYLMLLLDLKKPYLNWNSEHSVVKRNDNKSYQYALTIIMILIYMYLSNIFKEINVTETLIIEIIIFMTIFIIIDRIVKRKSNKLFDKII